LDDGNTIIHTPKTKKKDEYDKEKEIHYINSLKTRKANLEESIEIYKGYNSSVYQNIIDDIQKEMDDIESKLKKYEVKGGNISRISIHKKYRNRRTYKKKGIFSSTKKYRNNITKNGRRNYRK